jgi:UDP-3-O-[3-hydroxymyristoyl] glucosamine N-acyltransferase
MTFIANELTAAEVAAALSSAMPVDLQGARDALVVGLATYAASLKHSLSYQALDEELALSDTTIERAVICAYHNRLSTKAVARLIVDDPRAAFMYLVQHLLNTGRLDMERTVTAHARGVEPGRFDAHPTAIIEQPAILGAGVSLGAYVVIHRGTVIDKNTSIGTGSAIGEPGRALHKCADGRVLSWRKLHVGIVHVGEACEIGAHVAVNRAMLGETRIGKSTQMGNLVHISHGAAIAERVWLGSHSAVLGHVSIGSGATIGAHAVIRDNVDVGRNAAVAMGSVVAADVADDASVLGNPAKPVAGRLQPGPLR